MQYISTRGASPAVNSAEAVVAGLAPDGGLYVPAEIPVLDTAACLNMSTQEQAAVILSALLPDIGNMQELVRRAYAGKFQDEGLTPTVPVGDFTVLELFRGPTSAFKDVALSMLPQLLTAALQELGIKEHLRILTATSGDTGKAALEGFRDVPGVSICVFYPHGGVSAIQQAQMTTQQGSNVRVCAVEGNFDDAQTGVKEIFNRCTPPAGLRLSSANSINIGRLAPQVTYYYAAYRDLLSRGAIRLGERVNFSVPTGNFGDILAGYLAKRMGLPVGRLICASNANNVLTDFLRTGVYDRRRPLFKTISPSMDILVSSNLERLLYFASGDTALVASLMCQLREQGHYAVPEAQLDKLKGEFWADYCDDDSAKAVIGKVWQEHGYLCDPHTAAGWAAAESYRAETGDCAPMVVLSTASAFKFPDAVLDAIGAACEGDPFDRMEQLSRITGVPVPPNLADLRTRPVLHRDVIRKEDMPQYALAK